MIQERRDKVIVEAENLLEYIGKKYRFMAAFTKSEK